METVSQADRNPRLILDGSAVQLVSDPHFGYEYKVGVYPANTGKREEYVYHQIELLAEGADYLIFVGNTFSDVIVKPKWVLRTKQLFDLLLAKYPKLQIYLGIGTEEQHRHTNEPTTYDILKSFLSAHDRIHMMDHEPIVIEFQTYVIVMDCRREYKNRALNSKAKVFAPEIPYPEDKKLIYLGNWDTPEVVLNSFASYQPNLKMVQKAEKVFSGGSKIAFTSDLYGRTISYLGTTIPLAPAYDVHHEIFRPFKDLAEATKRDLFSGRYGHISIIGNEHDIVTFGSRQLFTSDYPNVIMGVIHQEVQDVGRKHKLKLSQRVKVHSKSMPVFSEELFLRARMLKVGEDVIKEVRDEYNNLKWRKDNDSQCTDRTRQRTL